jgi:L-xylulose reductase
MGEFSGRSVIVTGAGKGIGRAIALHLAGQGASIVAIARTEADLASLHEACGAKTIVADLGDVAQAQQAAAGALPADLPRDAYRELRSRDGREPSRGRDLRAGLRA